MNPEERLEALRDDARWNPISLYPEHGRMPAPAQPRPWRTVAGAAIVLVVVAAVFAGISLTRGLGDRAVPAPFAGTPTISSAPPVYSRDTAMTHARAWLAGAVLPPGAIESDAPPAGAPGAATDPPSWCFSEASGVFTYWTVPGMSAAEVRDFLLQHPSAGMTFTTVGTPTGPDLADHPAMQLVIQQPTASSHDGMMFTITSVGTSAVVRGEAKVGIGDPNDPGACPIAPTATIAATAHAREEAAARTQAHSWLEGALLPPASVRSLDAPRGAPSTPAEPPGWCAPEYSGEIVYWTVRNMSTDAVRDWLAGHLSPGMTAQSVTWPTGPDFPVSGTDQIVVEQPTPASAEGIIFTIASVGADAVVRVEAKAAIGNATC